MTVTGGGRGAGVPRCARGSLCRVTDSACPGRLTRSRPPAAAGAPAPAAGGPPGRTMMSLAAPPAGPPGRRTARRGPPARREARAAGRGPGPDSAHGEARAQGTGWTEPARRLSSAARCQMRTDHQAQHWPSLPQCHATGRDRDRDTVPPEPQAASDRAVTVTPTGTRSAAPGQHAMMP